MQVLRRLFIVLAWFFFGGFGLVLLIDGGNPPEVGFTLIGIAVVLTFAFNWVFADKKRDDE